MVIKHFLQWIGNAKVAQRVAAAEAIARAYLGNELPFEDRCESEAALTLLLDDPSAKVRRALAETLSISAHAPLQIVHALAGDQEDVAAPILIRSPLLTDLDLIDRLADAPAGIQCLIASRPLISMQLAAAIAEIGEASACLHLLANDGAQIATISFRRMSERFGEFAPMRDALLKDWRLPADCRHLLIVRLGEALSRSPLVMAMMGTQRAERVTREACIKACMTVIDNTGADEHAALVEHLRMRGELTAGFLVRAAACGKVDFLGAALIALSGQREARIRALLANGRDVALAALFRSAGLHAALHDVLICALTVWRDVAAGRRTAGSQEVSWLMLRRIDAAQGQAGPAEHHRELSALLRRIHLDALRDNARLHARTIAAA